MPKLIILVAPPCAGKSTWAKEYLSKNEKTVRFNRDELRLMLGNRLYLDSTGERLISALVISGMVDALIKGFDVIIDQTNCRMKYILEFVKAAINYADIEFKLFEIPTVYDLIYRGKQRAKKDGLPEIPEWVFSRMMVNYELLLTQCTFANLKMGDTDYYERLVK